MGSAPLPPGVIDLADGDALGELGGAPVMVDVEMGDDQVVDLLQPGGLARDLGRGKRT